MSGANVNASYVPKAQNLNELFGKMLRVDLTGDAYPADSLNSKFQGKQVNREQVDKHDEVK